MHWDFRVHDWRDYAIHMIFVAEQTVLASHAALVTTLAEILFYAAEVRSENMRISLLVALQIGAAFFEIMAGQTTAISRCTEMRFMDERREASTFGVR